MHNEHEDVRIFEPPPRREAVERRAALERGREQAAGGGPLCAPSIPGLDNALIYSLLAENVRDYAIFLMDPEGIIRCWGEGARLLKRWTRAEAEGAHLRLLYPDGGSEDGTAEAHLINATDTGEYSGEGHRVRSDDSTFWAYVTLTALRTPEGELVGFAKVTRDFSARRAVEGALQGERLADRRDTEDVVAESERLKRVIANLSHELRTPLNAIVGSIALLDAPPGESFDRRHVERLQRNAEHLLAMVDDLLQLSRAEAGEISLSPAEGRIGPVIQDALNDVGTHAAARNHTIVNAVSGTAGDLPYWGDATRVRQIVVNLLMNAIKFTDAGGRITISGGTALTVTGVRLAGPGPWLYVRVEDTGRGVAPDRLHAIFEPFQQGVVGDELRGSGLGLAISRQFARLMGGDISVESELGQGSQFTLWLPIALTSPVPR
jgi:PAS domain S-box-containing protein